MYLFDNLSLEKRVIIILQISFLLLQIYLCILLIIKKKKLNKCNLDILPFIFNVKVGIAFETYHLLHVLYILAQEIRVIAVVCLVATVFKIV